MYSCSQKDAIDLSNFDEVAWQSDKDGCAGIRTELRNDLINVKEELKGLNGDQVISALGKPNKTDLASRNQKYFIYNISCNTNSNDASTLSIRFNAVGLSYVVIVY
jgi:hypothetical protein